MASKLDIVNMALLEVGSRPLRSYDDRSNEGDIVRTYYETSVRSLLSSHRWNFAKRKITVSRLDIESEGCYSSYFPISRETNLRILSVSPKGVCSTRGELLSGSCGEAHQYEIMNLEEVNSSYGDSIAVVASSLQGPVDIEYIHRVDESHFPAEFSEAVYLDLAAKISSKIKASGTHKEQIETIARRSLKSAKRIDALQSPVKKRVRSNNPYLRHIL